MTVFIDLLRESVDEKHSALRAILSRTDDPRVHIVDAQSFKALPSSPFAYWAVPTAISAYARERALADAGYVAASTNQLSDDFRYARLWWECEGLDGWALWAKGRPYAPFYYDTRTMVRWSSARSTYTGFVGTKDRPLEKPASLEYFFRPGITWPRRSNRLSFSIMPQGVIFANKGPAVFTAIDDRGELLLAAAVLNSRVFHYLVGIQVAATELAQSFEVGIIQKTPLPRFDDKQKDELIQLSQRLWRFYLDADREDETSHAFSLPQGISCRMPNARDLASTTEIELLHRRRDEICYSAYEIGDDDVAAIELWHAGRSRSVSSLAGDDVDREAEDVLVGDTTVLSWSVGVGFGRFDIRLATGERPTPPEPDPFDPLPVKSPGMLPDGDTPFMPTSGVLVDDPGHADDLAALVTAVYERVGEAQPDALRRTLAKDFFPAHIRMYSKSRRKAPIYWQLATPSASYSVWLYIHAFGKDTLFRVQNDYVAPKLAHERRELEGLLAEAGPSPTTAQSRAIEAQTTFVEELSALLDEVKRIAPLWDPDLDDGVILNFAPLWRLVPQNRAWQKELSAAWASLVAGDFDWAHLSMRLWPERVVPKCAKDRSLAIAHDLEDVFWFEDAAGKWQARPTPTRQLDDLVAERTSTAVKAALQSLLDAPDPIAASGRGRRKKS